MSTNKIAKSSEEFDRRFDKGEDIHDLIDITKANIIRRPNSTENRCRPRGHNKDMVT
jgi:hypothetical protein